MYIDDEIKMLIQNSLPANNNSKKKGIIRLNKKIKPYFITPLILSTLLYAFSFVLDNNQPTFLLNQKNDITSQQTQLITAKQSDEIKKTVSLVALHEKKHPNTIHNELKRLFRYNSYKAISYEIYLKVIPHLKQRLK